MWPTLEPGACVLVDTRGLLPAIPNAIVVVTEPEKDGVALVKRVASVGARGFAVMSDSPVHARDSRQFGSLAPEQLVGPVTLSFDRSGGFRLFDVGSERASPFRFRSAVP